MEKYIKKRIYNEANYILKTNKTIREIARVFKISKSTVHKDLKDRLKTIDTKLYKDVQIIFQNHIKQRHIKGGMSTKKKYQKTT